MFFSRLGTVAGIGGGLSLPYGPLVGEKEYTTPGTYTWRVPLGVTSISAVAIGGGGGAKYNGNTAGGTGSGGGGGGAGALSYRNNIAVTPGTIVTITVGNFSGLRAGGGYSDISPANPGTASLIYVSSTLVVSAGGGLGGWGHYNGYLGGAGGVGAGVGDISYSGGTGGTGGSYTAGGGGLGASYTANGATGGTGSVTPAGSSLLGSIPGGGTLYGFGCSSNLNNSSSQMVGGTGAVRIIWPGTVRSFPSTNTMVATTLSMTPTIAYSTFYSVFAITAFTPVSVTGGLSPVTYSVSPSLPTGLTLNTSTGYISGAPASAVANTYTMTVTDAAGQISSANFNITVIESSQIAYTTAGTYSWTAPAGVTSISVVAVGGGGGGGGSSIYPTNQNGGGGGGGGLGYKNNISVTPGETYTVVVGAKKNQNTTDRASIAGDSYFISDTLVKGGGAGSGVLGTGGTGGTFIGDGGGNGGKGGSAGGGQCASGGGGGAGGYAGDGGKGGSNVDVPQNSTVGSGGGGGGGEYAAATLPTYAFGGRGGGVGLLGQGANGTRGFGVVGTSGNPGGGGSGATINYGCGSGGWSSGSVVGAVRIIWPGNLRSFPSTKTTDAIPLLLNVAVPTKSLIASATAITAFTPITVTSGSGTVTLSISPALPTGLTFNTSTGAISGTINVGSFATTYTVSATDSFSSTTSATFSLAVVPQSQISYSTAGTYSWTAPAGVGSVSVVCVGGGGGAGNYAGGGGAGGGLVYGNNIPVVPGQSYTVVVGAAGAANGGNGGDSYFVSSSALKAGGGGGGSTAGVSGATGGGGGAAGYTGNGGAAGNATVGDTPSASGGVPSGTSMSGGGTGGAGGKGGAAGSTSAFAGGGGAGGGGYAGVGGGSPGGGVGINGRGADGAGAPLNGNAQGGSGGSNAVTGTAGVFGGGGAYYSSSQPGGVGAVRIIWPGDTRYFPTTNTINK